MSRRELILGTAGHIDHGKTALVRALTGTETDRLAEERRRGISIDLGFAHLALGDGPDGVDLGIVDVPGHERFVKNMLAGASGVDLALLVVAADDSVMPQTREHLAILDLLGVRRGLVVLTKCDLADASWLDLVEEDIRTLVAGSFLAGAPIVRTSATTGAGLDDLRAVLATVCADVTRRADGDLFRMPVDRAFVLQGLGTVVTGTVRRGRVEGGQTIAWLPSGREVRVRGVQSHGTATDAAAAGRRAALNLMGVHHAEIRRGHELATPGFLTPTRRLTVRMRLLEDCPWPVRHRARVRLHLGTQVTMATVRLPGGGAVEPGGTAFAQLACADTVTATCRQPFVLRSESPVRTLGGGAILRPDPPPWRRGADAPVALLPDLESTDARVRATAALRLRGTRAWTALDLCREADLDRREADALCTVMESEGEVITLPLGPGRTARLHRSVRDDLHARIRSTLERLHAGGGLSARVPRPQLARALRDVDHAVLDRTLDELQADNALLGDETAVALPDHAPDLTAAQRALREQVLATYRDAAFAPPDTATLVRDVRATPAQVERILTLCTGEGSLVRLHGGLVLHRARADEMEDRIMARLASGPGMTVSEIKQLLGTSRKFAVPICEHLDRIGLTRRDGDRRVLARAAGSGPSLRYDGEAAADVRSDPHRKEDPDR